MPDPIRRSVSGTWRLRAAKARQRAAKLYDRAELHPRGSPQRALLYASAADLAEHARECIRHAEAAEKRAQAMYGRTAGGGARDKPGHVPICPLSGAARPRRGIADA